LAWCPSANAKFAFPLRKPSVFDVGLFCLRQVRFGIAVNEERNRQHVTVGSLMANTLAFLALDPWEIGTTALVWTCKMTLGDTQGTATVALVAAVNTLTVVTTVVRLATATMAGTCVVSVSVYPIE
jgi:hypothetical protein